MTKEEIKDTMVRVAESNMEIHAKADVMLVLKEQYDKADLEDDELVLNEGDVIHIERDVGIVAKVFNAGLYAGMGQKDFNMAIVYIPLRKELEVVHENYYKTCCEKISHIDPKMIFREDIKCV